MLDLNQFIKLDRIKNLSNPEQKRQYFIYCCDYFIYERSILNQTNTNNTSTSTSNTNHNNTSVSTASAGDPSKISISNIKIDSICNFLKSDDNCCILQEDGKNIFI